MVSGFVVAVSIKFCFVQTADQTFFLHQSDILKGKHLVEVGERVEFIPAPPLLGKKYPRATRAVVGSAQ